MDTYLNISSWKKKWSTYDIFQGIKFIINKGINTANYIYIYIWCTPTDLSKLPYLKNFKTFTLFARNKDCPFLHTFIFYTNNFIIITSPINRVIVFVKSLVKSVSNGQFSPLKSNFSDNKENTPEMFNTNAQSISLSVKYLRVHVFHSHK